MVLPSIENNCAYFFWSFTTRQEVSGGRVGAQAAPLRFVLASAFLAKSALTVQVVAAGISFCPACAFTAVNAKAARPAHAMQIEPGHANRMSCYRRGRMFHERPRSDASQSQVTGAMQPKSWL